MKIVSSGLLMISGACFALGLIHLRFWLAERERRDYLAFTIVCFSTAVYAGFEILLMNAVTPAEYNHLVRWGHIPAAVALVSVAWFTFANLGGRRWLFWTIFASRGLALVLNFIFTPNISFRQITSIKRITILGEQLSYPVGEPNPWIIVAQLSFLLIIIFCVDSSVQSWRRGDRRKALVFGTGILLFTVSASVLAIGVMWKLVEMPLMASVSIVFLIAAMFSELNHDMHRLARLSGKLLEQEGKLRETIQQLNLSAGAANVGVWTRKLGDEAIWVSDVMRRLFSFSSVEPITMTDFLQRVHADDRGRVQGAISEAESQGKEYNIEYRITLDDGQIRWIESRGTAELFDGKINMLRGASVDVTKRKAAEVAVHDLSRKLINAQERERARLARELHDDLNQSLALLSIRLGELRQNSGDPDFVRSEIDHLDSEVHRLSADIHRISHELHPAKLKQLGLEAALRGFCREIESAYPIDLTFDAENLPRVLPADVSLCLYRITQESLQNVVKHSGADSAHVYAKAEDGEIILTVSDNGRGFDIDATKTKESLGLISISERVRAVNGSLEITSKIGAGSMVEARVPVGREIN